VLGLTTAALTCCCDKNNNSTRAIEIYIYPLARIVLIVAIIVFVSQCVVLRRDQQVVSVTKTTEGTMHLF